MKKLGILLVSFCVVLGLAAQSSDRIIQSEGGKLFLNHTTAPKENFYSIGRLYNISPKEIAPFNQLSLTDGLEINQEVKIPLTNTNFAQQGTAASDEVFVPLYHMVEEKEGLYRIGQNFNKVHVNDLKAWNNLSSESISNGQLLIVGYLRVKADQSALAVNGIKKIGGGVSSSTAPTPPVVVKTETGNPSAKPVEQPVAKTVETVQRTNDTGGSEGTGFFKASYSQQSGSFNGFKSEMGVGAIFKSTSGWQDGKYYALMNNITPGTIVRITNSNNNRIIFAKVLGELPPGKENEGLLIRISNAASVELKIGEKELKFAAEVAYAKNTN